jgi:hypothetical protein
MCWRDSLPLGRLAAKEGQLITELYSSVALYEHTHLPSLVLKTPSANF